jgi:3'-phosphoadenosine 5'-phosphosulfate sulfotransferase
VRWSGSGVESIEHFSELLTVAIVQSARHEETIGEVDDARARARALAAHFRSTYGVSDFALY